MSPLRYLGVSGRGQVHAPVHPALFLCEQWLAVCSGEFVVTLGQCLLSIGPYSVADLLILFYRFFLCANRLLRIHPIKIRIF